MGMMQDRFEEGMTIDQYVEQMTRNRERFEANRESVTFDAADLAYFAGLEEPRNVLVLAEDWCGDVIANLPVLGQLARESGKLKLRVFLRDQNEDLMDRYLNDGKYRSIPTFVFFDSEFRELGRWVERPAKMTELKEQVRQDLFANDPELAGIKADLPFGQLPEQARERLRDAMARFSEEHRAYSDREVVREIRALLEHGKAQAQPTLQAEKQSIAAPPIAVSAADRVAGPITGKVKVTITYCADCGYEPQTLELASALMRAFVHDLSAIELIPWRDGSFDVTVNDDLIHSMYRDGGFPEPETIVQAVRARMP